MKRLWSFIAWAGCLVCLALPVRAGEPRPEELDPEERPAQAAIRELAVKTIVRVGDGSEAASREAQLRPQPVLKYGDETRDIKDSALWVWFDRELPVLFEKIEVNDRSPTFPLWTFCVASFAEAPLTMTMTGPVRNPPIRISAAAWAPLPDAPAAAERAEQWPLQARGLARQFSVETHTGEERTELRLLPRPLVEFRPKSPPVVYGAVFGYARGTNADVLIQFRLTRSDAGEPQWSCSIAQMTSERIVVRRGEEVVAEPAPQAASEISNWGYFFRPRDPFIR